MAALWFPHAEPAPLICEPMAPLVLAMECCSMLHLVIVGEEEEMTEAECMCDWTHTHNLTHHMAHAHTNTLVEC